MITETVETSKELRRIVNYALDIEVPILLLYVQQVQLPKSLQLSTAHVAALRLYELGAKEYKRELSKRLAKNLMMTRQEKQTLTIGSERICPTHIKIKLANEHRLSSEQPIPPRYSQGFRTGKTGAAISGEYARDCANQNTPNWRKEGMPKRSLSFPACYAQRTEGKP